MESVADIPLERFQFIPAPNLPVQQAAGAGARARPYVAPRGYDTSEDEEDDDEDDMDEDDMAEEGDNLDRRADDFLRGVQNLGNDEEVDEFDEKAEYPADVDMKPTIFTFGARSNKRFSSKEQKPDITGHKREPIKYTISNSPETSSKKQRLVSDLPAANLPPPDQAHGEKRKRDTIRKEDHGHQSKSRVPNPIPINRVPGVSREHKRRPENEHLQDEHHAFKMSKR